MRPMFTSPERALRTNRKPLNSRKLVNSRPAGKRLIWVAVLGATGLFALSAVGNNPGRAPHRTAGQQSQPPRQPLQMDVQPDFQAGVRDSPGRKARPEPDDAGEAIRWRRLSWVDEKGQVPPNALMTAVQSRLDSVSHWQRLAAQGDPEAAALGLMPSSWTFRGPQNVGGRTRSLVIHPTNPNILWAASVGGGVWKSTNAGATWTPTDDFMANLAATCLAMDPTDSNVLYCGTGEGFFNGDALQGAGIFKTTDGGTTWNQMPSTANWAGDGSGRISVNRIAVAHPNNNIILASTRDGGVQRTTDGGLTWATVRSGLGSYYVAFNPNDSTKAVAHIIDYDSGVQNWFHTAVYSTDSGATWHDSNLQHVWDFNSRIELAYAPSSPNIVYANLKSNFQITCGSPPCLSVGSVWRSTDGGRTFARTTDVQYDTLATWYNNTIWVSPTDPNFLVVGGSALFKSIDGGATVQLISAGYLLTQEPHADEHFLVAEAGFDGSTNRRLYVCNDGGVFRADNIFGASTSSGWVSLNTAYRTTQYYGAAGNAGTGRVVGGTQDNGTLTNPAGDVNAKLMFGGDGGFAAVDPIDDTYCYGEHIYLQIHRSQDHGLTSNYIFGGISDAGTLANFTAPFILDPNNRDRMLAGGQSLWRSSNVRLGNPPSWTPIWSPGFDFISAIAVAPGNSNIIWVAQNNGGVYKTNNGLAPAPTWITVDDNNTINPLPDRYPARILIDQDNSNIVYIALGGFSSGNLQRTTDGGVTWTALNGTGAASLPLAPIRGIARDPANANALYVGTEVGVFSSLDGGAHWSATNQGPANVSVDELVFLAGSRILLAATHGRGVWQANLDASGKHLFDFDGDSKTDISIWRASTGVWWIIDSSTGSFTQTGWGVPGAGDIPVAGDYDGDGKTDVAIWRASTGDWWIMNSSSGSITHTNWGLTGAGDIDIPVPGDYDGDGKTDIAIWRATTGDWWIINSSNGSITHKNWGLTGAGDIPVPGDYDGDGKTDIAIWRASTGDWWIINSSTGSFTHTGWGVPGVGDIPVPGDYDGDGKTDIAIWRATTGDWWIVNSSNGSITHKNWGLTGAGDVPVPGDYDGDGKTDIAIWRATTGDWWIINSSNGSFTHTNWGLPGAGDIAVPSSVK
jgi:hypothetical protein